MKTARISLMVLAALGLAITLALPGAAQAPDGGYRTFRPDGPGPHPAVAFVSGCSGFAPSFAPRAYERAAEQLRAEGFLVVYVDYLGRRGLQSCARAALTHSDGARDLVAATAWLRSQPSVDRARLAAIGWSYGGGIVLAALAEQPEETLGLSRAVVFYPDCRSVKPWKPGTPVLMLYAGDDDVAPGKACQAAVGKNAAPGAVKSVVYPGALHAFDVADLPARMQYPFGTIGHHPQAATAAWEEIQRFLTPMR